MDDKTQKERLEQEMMFLKESFEAEVISKEEYEKGKDRIEKKLKEIEKSQQNKSEETKNEATVESKETEKIKLRIIQDEGEEHKYEQIQKIEQKKTEEPLPETIKTEIEEPKEESKFFKYAAVFVVLVFVVFFLYSFLKSGHKPQEKSSLAEFVAACKFNDDCKQEGKEGICINPGAKDAKCEFKAIQKINVLILNDRKNCFNCDIQRVLNILKTWFGTLDTKEIDYNTDVGKNLAEKLDSRLLPTYILDENITKKSAFEKFKQTFIKKDNNYILSKDAAGSTFYFKRDNIPNKLDLFVKENESAGVSAEKNLKEFLEVFKEVKFEKHLPDDELTKELDIKTFPTFLVNNRVKFSGVHTAETVKNNFCKLNKVSACEKILSKNLI